MTTIAGLSELFASVGTTSAPLPPAPARIVVGPLVGRRPGIDAAALIEAFHSTGVLLVTLDDVRGWQRHVLDVGTYLALPAERVSLSDPVDFASAVQDLRHRSGLTWQELADALGVSRRTVHHWATGGRVSTAHARLIEDLAALVDETAAPSPVLTRERLLAPRRSGPSFLAAFRAASAPRRSTPLSTLSVADVLTDEPLEEPPPTPHPRRRSSMAPRRFGSRRSTTE
jgi:transcriptional regulator with XRE-family HTH domain